MKICGIIAEYNPFHEGHAYHLHRAKELSGADAVVVIMSGHFVQRGEPAIADPYARAEAALRHGADAVFMMPPEASTASAEGFAAYGVGVLDALGCDFISCGVEPAVEDECGAEPVVEDECGAEPAAGSGAEGKAQVKAGCESEAKVPVKTECESEAKFPVKGRCEIEAQAPVKARCGTDMHERSSCDTDSLRKLADKLAYEDGEMGGMIRSALKRGLSYPAALAEAAGVERLGPNSILAIEYMKAMVRLGSRMELVPVARVGSGYSDTEITEGQYPSATALRKQILAGAPMGSNKDVHADKHKDGPIGNYSDSPTGGLDVPASGTDLPMAENCKNGKGPFVQENCKNGKGPNVQLFCKNGKGLIVQFPIGADDVVPMIVESIRNHAGELEDFADCSPEIASRIRNSRLHYRTFEDMVTDLKTKDVTYTRVARVLTHILLGIRQDDTPKLSGTEGVRPEIASYAQLIGFSNPEVLTELNKRAAQKMGDDFTIISKAADHKDVLSGGVYASEVYNQALWNKYHIDGKDFFRQQILKI